jgi:site-specific DNA recombinase
MRLMGALEPRPPFTRLVVSEQKSLGREAFETNYRIKQLAEAGVEVFEYVHGKSLTPRNVMEKFMSSAQSYGDETHREQSAERVTEAHTRLAKAGYVTGGRVFGYRNVDVFNGTDPHGRPLRSHVEREIDKKEAAVVRRIFTLYDSGLGLKAIGKQLTREGAPSPKPPNRKDGLTPLSGWAPSTVRSVLTRELYRGVSVWGKTKKKNDWGKRDPHSRPETEWKRTVVEHLRIIDEPLWRRVAARRREAEGRALRFAGGRMSGRPPKYAVQNLLAGLATCGVCGGGLVVEWSNNRKGRYAYYMCHRRRHHGSSCTNALRMPVSDVNEAVLQAIEQHALTPEAVEQVILLTERDDARGRQVALQRERKSVEKRIARLVAAVETAGDVASLAEKLREVEARRAAIDRDLLALHPVPRLPRTIIENRLAEWRRLLRQSTTQGRAVLQRVLQGRITFTPAEAGYTFQAPTRFDKLFSGVAAPRPAFIEQSSHGAEHIGPEDTFDGDYGRLLERAVAGNGWRALQDSNLRPPGS